MATKSLRIRDHLLIRTDLIRRSFANSLWADLRGLGKPRSAVYASSCPMTTNGQARPTHDGVLFGPNSKGHTYISLGYHRKTRNPDKCCWHPDVTRHREFELFSEADERGFGSSGQALWNVLNKGRNPTGQSGERVAKFPRPSNPSDPWHGYPASPALKGPTDRPPDELIQRWRSTDHITRRWARKIQQDLV